jgi:hypothetical protein
MTMSQPIRSFSRWLPHLPWLAAIVVLAVGVVASSRRPAEEAPVTQENPPTFHMDESAFRQTLNLDELYDPAAVPEENR